MTDDEWSRIQLLPEYEKLFIKELLWSSVEKYLKTVEVEEVKKKIGVVLLEENEDYFKELRALLSILLSYKKETRKLEKKVSLSRVSGEMMILQSNIKSLTKFLKKNAIEKLKKNEKNVEIINFMKIENKPTRKKNKVTGRRRSSGSSTSSTSSVDLNLENMKDDLNVFNIDKIGDQIRKALASEKELLKCDIEYIRTVMEREIEFSKKASSYVVPSVKDLKEFEKEVKECITEEKQKSFIQNLPGLETKKNVPKKLQFRRKESRKKLKKIDLVSKGRGKKKIVD